MAQAPGAQRLRRLVHRRRGLAPRQPAAIVARVAVFRAIYTELNAKLLLQALPLGEVETLTAAEADATRITIEGQVDRPWNLWKQLAQAAALQKTP